jgi:hypothetical protein
MTVSLCSIEKPQSGYIITVITLSLLYLSAACLIKVCQMTLRARAKTIRITSGEPYLR